MIEGAQLWEARYVEGCCERKHNSYLTSCNIDINMLRLHALCDGSEDPVIYCTNMVTCRSPCVVVLGGAIHHVGGPSIVARVNFEASPWVDLKSRRRKWVILNVSRPCRLPGRFAFPLLF